VQAPAHRREAIEGLYVQALEPRKLNANLVMS